MAGTGSAGKLAEIGQFDFMEEDDYREWTKAVLALGKQFILEIEISRKNLEGLLAHTPTAQDGKSIKNLGASKRGARGVSSRLGRAAQDAANLQGHVRGAFAYFEKVYLGEVAATKNGGAQNGMRLNRNGRTRTRANTNTNSTP
jgi:hypothetical protein